MSFSSSSHNKSYEDSRGCKSRDKVYIITRDSILSYKSKGAIVMDYEYGSVNHLENFIRASTG